MTMFESDYSAPPVELIQLYQTEPGKFRLVILQAFNPALADTYAIYYAVWYISFAEGTNYFKL